MSLTKLGRYDLIRVLGKGAMGLVYEGRDPNLDRRVAIKTIKVESLSEEAAAEYEVRFRIEARSAARLQHPNIVSVYDSDRHGDIAFLVMEFIQGDDLKHHLDQGELYTLQQSLAIMTDLLSALEYAHKQSIVHRDIKPANLLIEAGGRVKLTDFGVARIQDSGEATRTQGSMVGTLKYMSPEQVQGRPVDARADIFAAGIVLYQLLTGKRPFDGDTDFAIIQQIVRYTPAGPTSFNAKLPHAIDAVMARALAKSRDLRYASAQEFSTALQSACREAVDPMALPQAVPPGPGSSSTWTSTLMAGEALVGTRPGQTTQTGMGTKSGIPASAVTQEVELVYWKDIKDSIDVEDIQGFLAKFPDGIYADLARRRLRKLGAAAGDATDTGLRSGTGTLRMPRGSPAGGEIENTLMDAGNVRKVIHAADLAAKSPTSIQQPAPTLQDAPLLPAFVEDDATVALARFGPSDPQGDETIPITRPADAVMQPTVAASASKRSSTDTPEKTGQDTSVEVPVDKSLDELVNNSVNASEKASIGTPANPANPLSPVSPSNDLKPVKPGPVVSPVGLTAAALPTKPAPSATASRRTGLIAAMVVAMALLAAGATWLSSGRSAVDPASLASPDPVEAAASASAITDNVAPAAVAPAAAASAPTAKTAAASAATVNAATAAAAPAKKTAVDKERLSKTAQAKPVPAQATAPAKDKPLVPAVASSGGSASEICEGRILFAFQTCMSEQCAKPAFKLLPVCVERRAMDQRRREAEQSR